ncbi:MAG: hypothetical protein ABSF03_13600 [Streptosporangiaceae bacterium]|jgi:hypothetical protein
MSYQTDDGRHEGWDAAEFPDGRFSVGSENGGTSVRFLGPGLDPGAGRGVLDGRAAIGWRGPLWRKVSGAGHHDPATHKVYDSGPSVYGDAPFGIEDASWLEWHGHLPPPSLADVREAAEDARKAQTRLDEAVQRARADSCSWTSIGDAARTTCTAAQERWGKP